MKLLAIPCHIRLFICSALFYIGLENRLEILDKDQPSQSTEVIHHQTISLTKSEESCTKLRAVTGLSDESTDTFETARSTISDSKESDVLGEKKRSCDIVSDDARHNIKKLQMSNTSPSMEVSYIEFDRALPNGESQDQTDPVPIMPQRVKPEVPNSEPGATKQGRRTKLSFQASLCPCCAIL